MIQVFTKFKPGDMVYIISQEPIRTTVICDACGGVGSITHNNIPILCPKCKNKELSSLSKWRIWVPSKEPTIISSVKAKISSSCTTIAYNTGYAKRAEQNVFATKEAAQRACNILNKALIEDDTSYVEPDSSSVLYLNNHFEIGEQVYITTKVQKENHTEIEPFVSPMPITEVRATIYSYNAKVRYKLELSGVKRVTRSEERVFSSSEEALAFANRENALQEVNDEVQQ